MSYEVPSRFVPLQRLSVALVHFAPGGPNVFIAGAIHYELQHRVLIQPVLTRRPVGFVNLPVANALIVWQAPLRSAMSIV